MMFITALIWTLITILVITGLCLAKICYEGYKKSRNQLPMDMGELVKDSDDAATYEVAANTGTGNDDRNRNLSTEGAPSTCFMSQHETTATFTDPVPQNLVKTWEEHGKTMAHIPKP